MKLFFRKYGKGVPVIILHGLYGCSDNWRSIAKRLSNNFEIYLIDLRNHGNSPHSDDMSFFDMSNDLLEFYNDCSIDKAILIGHSMGGKIAMCFANQNSERVSKMIIIDIAPRITNSKIQDEISKKHINIINALLSVDINNIASRKEVDIQIANIIKPNNLRMFLLKNLHRNTDNSFSWKFNLEALKKNLNNLLDNYDFEVAKDNSHQLLFPVLFVKGETSDYLVREDFPFIKAIFKNTQFQIVKNAGHWVHAEKPNELTEIIIKYIVSENRK